MSISIEHLTKRYARVAALDEVSIEIPSGSVFGLLGPNGAGKTTTFKCMLGLARANSGTVRFGGKTLTPQTFEDLAYVPERSVLYEWMTVAEHLEMQKRAFAKYNKTRAAELTGLFALDPRKQVRALSKGMRTALEIVMAFAVEPKIMVLDEPTSGLDPVNQRAVLNLIIDASAQGSTIIFSSHQIGQVERAADHIAVLQRGKIILAGVVDDLKAGCKIIEGIFPSEAAELNGLRGDPRITHVEQTGRIVRFTVTTGSEELSARLGALGAQGVRTIDLGLEDIFLNAVDAGHQTAGVMETV